MFRPGGAFRDRNSSSTVSRPPDEYAGPVVEVRDSGQSARQTRRYWVESDDPRPEGALDGVAYLPDGALILHPRHSDTVRASETLFA